MIKIIKQGTKKQANCENCGCVFSYESDDIKYDTRQTYGGFPKIGREYISCPQCGEEIIIKQTR